MKLAVVVSYVDHSIIVAVIGVMDMDYAADGGDCSTDSQKPSLSPSQRRKSSRCGMTASDSSRWAAARRGAFSFAYLGS